jgi:hypothetical protein
MRLELANEGETHPQLLDQLSGLDIDIAPGSKEEVSVTFQRSARVLFYCKFHAT